MDVYVDSLTQFLDDPDGVKRFDELEAGQRIEVSCRVDINQRWIARKIKTQAIKQSDKFKGTVTRVDATGDETPTLEIFGLKVRLEPQKTVYNPSSQLLRIEKASQMMQAIQEYHISTSELLLEKRADPRERERSEEALEDLEHYIQECKTATEAILAQAKSSTAEPDLGELDRWLEPLESRSKELRALSTRFFDLAKTSPTAAQLYLNTTIDPYLQNKILPLIYAYHSNAEELLSSEVKAISDNASTTTRIVLFTSVLAVLLAIVLSIWIGRAISKPLAQLHWAATRIGQGHLETRVDIRSNDELGVLGAAFNQMAEELATTTVSINDLKGVLDSMASALIILDPDQNIINCNKAALDLLGHARNDLIDQPFDLICRSADHEEPILIRAIHSGSTSPIEEDFHRSDDTKVSVALSVAALQGDEDRIQGYVVVAQDLTERKDIERNIQRSLEEKELLLREIHHRVKNNLQVICSLLDLQSAFVSDPVALEKFNDSQNRVRSMALIHEQLYQSTDLDTIEVSNYLQFLTAQLLQSSANAESRIAIDLEVAQMDLSIDQALTIGLIVNELVTNSLKHAYQPTQTGRIRVSLHENDGFRELSVSDDGCGAPGLDLEQTNTLGMSLIYSLSSQLQGKVVLESPPGMNVRIRFPADSSQPVVSRS